MNNYISFELITDYKKKKVWYYTGLYGNFTSR